MTSGQMDSLIVSLVKKYMHFHLVNVPNICFLHICMVFFRLNAVFHLKMLPGFGKRGC